MLSSFLFWLTEAATREFIFISGLFPVLMRRTELSDSEKDSKWGRGGSHVTVQQEDLKSHVVKCQLAKVFCNTLWGTHVEFHYHLLWLWMGKPEILVAFLDWCHVLQPCLFGDLLHHMCRKPLVQSDPWQDTILIRCFSRMVLWEMEWCLSHCVWEEWCPARWWIIVLILSKEALHFQCHVVGL